MYHVLCPAEIGPRMQPSINDRMVDSDTGENKALPMPLPYEYSRLPNWNSSSQPFLSGHPAILDARCAASLCPPWVDELMQSSCWPRRKLTA